MYACATLDAAAEAGCVLLGCCAVLCVGAQVPQEYGVDSEEKRVLGSHMCQVRVLCVAA
jgi:hypothetical protein